MRNEALHTAHDAALERIRTADAHSVVYVHGSIGMDLSQRLCKTHLLATVRSGHHPIECDQHSSTFTQPNSVWIGADKARTIDAKHRVAFEEILLIFIERLP